MTTAWTLPDLGENISKAKVLRVLVAPGDTVTATQAVLEVETDKVNVEVPAGRDGTITDVKVREGDSVSPGAELLVFAAGADAAPAAAPAAPAPAQPAAPTAAAPTPPPAPAAKTPAPAAVDRPPAALPTDGVRAAPVVRKTARELGLDIRAIPASGPEGMLLHDDVMAYARELLAGTGSATSTPTAATLPDFAKWGAVTREPMSSVRETTAKRMTQAWTTIPHVTQFDQANVTAIEALRVKLAPAVEKSGGKLTMTVLLMRAAAAALRQFPQCNASIDMAHSEIILKEYIHIGIAVDTPAGLVVPVVRNVDQTSIADLAQAVPTLAKRARDRKLTMDDLQGGTFTISNLGGVGGTAFTPIINPPEVAILGVSRSEWAQILVGKKWTPALRLPLSLSYDHRLIDGADAARFLRAIIAQLEDPSWVSAEFVKPKKPAVKKAPVKKPIKKAGRKK